MIEQSRDTEMLREPTDINKLIRGLRRSRLLQLL